MENLKSKLQTMVPKLENTSKADCVASTDESKFAPSSSEDSKSKLIGGAKSKLSSGMRFKLGHVGSAIARATKSDLETAGSSIFSGAREKSTSKNVSLVDTPNSDVASVFFPNSNPGKGPDKNGSNSSSDIANSSISSDEDSADKSGELEKSGLYVPGYTGPIHKWQHPGYQFFAEPPKDTFPETERLFKVIIVGDATVGKTTFVQRYVNNVFRETYKGTVGVDFALKVMWKSENEIIKLQLWDIAGQERFTWMTRAYYRDAHGCIIMFDLTSNSSFINAMKWKRDVDGKCQLPDGSLLPAVLIGNKCDLPHRAVNQEQVELVFKTHNYIGWTEVSAKENLMVNDCMKFLVDSMISRNVGEITRKEKPLQEANLNGSVNPKDKKKWKCC